MQVAKFNLKKKYLLYLVRFWALFSAVFYLRLKANDVIYLL